MKKSLRHFVSGKLIIGLLAFGTVGFMAQSCQKHACGSRHQKRVRNRHVKNNTTFMTY